MSLSPSDQRCLRCQAPLMPGAPTCPMCGLVLGGASSYGASQPATSYVAQGGLVSAPTVASALYPQEAAPPAYSPSSLPPVDYASLYAGSQAPASAPLLVPSSSFSGPPGTTSLSTGRPPRGKRTLALV